MEREGVTVPTPNKNPTLPLFRLSSPNGLPTSPYYGRRTRYPVHTLEPRTVFPLSETPVCVDRTLGGELRYVHWNPRSELKTPVVTGVEVFTFTVVDKSYKE